MRATAEACANIALVKYWGKREAALNLPARGSLSVTMGALRTRTTVAFDEALPEDQLVVDGLPRPGAAARRATRVLDLVRAVAGLATRARVVSDSTFPYAAGLASSASGMAALAVAAARAAGLRLSDEALSVIARRGSGSAARSIHGGFVEWQAGVRDDGADSHGVQRHPAAHWDLRVVVALVAAGEKATSSTDGMVLTEETSPYHAAWLATVDRDLAAARDALATRDLAALGRVAESSCLRMHADMLAADPGLVYWQPATLGLVHAVRALRDGEGVPVWFTIDAGPHVKALTLPGHAATVAARLASVPGVVRVLESTVGGPARVVEEDVA